MREVCGRIRVNWCKSCGGGSNFGDQLTPALLTHHKRLFEWSSPPAAHLLMVGSILSKVPNGWRGTVLGTGFIKESYRRDLSQARVLAVRGALTRDRANVSGKTPLGDMGVLVGELPHLTWEKMLDPLVIPHYVDRDIETMMSPLAGYSVMPITAEIPSIISAIESAPLVITSSLHALIAADALGIPHIWQPHERVIGAGFKFDDYASAFDIEIRPGAERLTDRAKMTAKQDELRALLVRMTF